MTKSTATKGDLHTLVDELPDETVETARRFLQSLRNANTTENFIERFLGSMREDERALLDGLAELDRDLGDPEPSR